MQSVKEGGTIHTGVWRSEGEEMRQRGDGPSCRRRTKKRSRGERNLAHEGSQGHGHPEKEQDPELGPSS